MSTLQFPFSTSKENNPTTHNLYYQDVEEGVIAPGTAKIICSEDFVNITTENDVLITTEGV